jgi:KUP system potassium uptake protein
MAEPAADKPASNPLEAEAASKTPPAAPEGASETAKASPAPASTEPDSPIVAPDPELDLEASMDGSLSVAETRELPPHEAPPPTVAPSSTVVGPESVVVTDAKSHHAHGGRQDHAYLALLALGALGVVYGDIGTSPLYSLRECFHGSHGVPVTPHNVYGVLSLVFWSLTLIISIKYLSYILRADNKGEGGTLALMALASSALKSPRARTLIALLGVFGSALVYGDGMITPAISVLSAVEGLEIAAPQLHSFVVPITIVILIGLFAIQRHGTARVGALIGPVMVIWFTTLAVLGVANIIRHPEVLGAVWPGHAVRFFHENKLAGVSVLGSVVLVITGGEALYADLGHFGKKPIRLAWFGLVAPALTLNYFGQGSLIIHDVRAIENPFFLLAPTWALLPLVVLSTAATVIASQAMISGVYSLTRAAAMLGFLPRVNVQHTSAHERGQIYVPSINWLLMLAAIALVLGFGSSSNLAAAYGIAVTMTMVLTTVMAFFLTRFAWGWSLPKSLAVTAIFLIPELFFVGANLTKVAHGGWFPLVLGAGLFAIMTTWKRGRAILFQRFQEKLLPLPDFYELMHVEIPARVPGTAVFMTSADGTPPAMLHNFLHNRVVHQHIVLLTIVTSDDARVAEGERCTIEQLENGFVKLVARYGFMERPDVPQLLLRSKLISNVEHTTFFLGRETMIATARPGMARWRVHLFAFLARNALPATRFFNIPPDRVMEIGAQIEL